MFTDPAFLASMVDALQPMFAWGMEGYADDRLADGPGWGGFDVSTISCPVTVLHGAADTICPIVNAHAHRESRAERGADDHAGRRTLQHRPPRARRTRQHDQGGEVTDCISVERDAALDGLVTITLNRPDKLNALNIALHDELQPVLVDLETDASARVVIFTGAGRAFSAGADLNDRRDAKPLNDIDRLQRAHIGGRTYELIDRLPQVVIAAVNGLAVGGAVVFLTACDMRLAAESAWFSIPEVELGMPLTWQAIPRLIRELGPARTKELVMACDRFTAQQALERGASSITSTPTTN